MVKSKYSIKCQYYTPETSTAYACTQINICDRMISLWPHCYALFKWHWWRIRLHAETFCVSESYRESIFFISKHLLYSGITPCHAVYAVNMHTPKDGVDGCDWLTVNNVVTGLVLLNQVLDASQIKQHNRDTVYKELVFLLSDLLRHLPPVTQAAY